jgi:hypothetical protein
MSLAVAGLFPIRHNLPSPKNRNKKEEKLGSKGI